MSGQCNIHGGGGVVVLLHHTLLLYGSVVRVAMISYDLDC